MIMKLKFHGFQLINSKHCIELIELGTLWFWSTARCIPIQYLEFEGYFHTGAIRDVSQFWVSFLANFLKWVEKFIRSSCSQLNLQFSSKLGYLASVCLNLPLENDFRLNQVIFYNNFSFEVHTITCFRLATLPMEGSLIDNSSKTF